MADPGTKAQKIKKSRVAITAEEAKRMALEFYGPGKRRALFEIVGTDASQISDSDAFRSKVRDSVKAHRAIRHAVEAGLVEVVETRRVKLQDELGQALRDAYPQLLGVQVVDLSRLPFKDARSYDDSVHEELGFAAARWISQGMLFQDGSIIGVGSGRGVYQTLNALKDFQQLSSRDVKVMSLTARIHAKNHAGAQGRDLDADFHAALLATCFNHASISLLPLPIAQASPGDRERAARRTHLADAQWSKVAPRYGLFGVGILAPGHRLYDESMASKREEGLKAILPQVMQLVEISEQVHTLMAGISPLYYPVADIANQLFTMQGSLWDRIEKNIQTRIEALVAEINCHLLTITEAQLRDIENVVLIAGTESKALAIRSLLERERSNIRFLCTDGDAARQILNKPMESELFQP